MIFRLSVTIVTQHWRGNSRMAGTTFSAALAEFLEALLMIMAIITVNGIVVGFAIGLSRCVVSMMLCQAVADLAWPGRGRMVI